MKKRNMFILFVVICIGLFIPKNTFALQVYNNVNIDYRFFVDEDENDAGNLKFRLYDKSGTLNFESKYDSNTKQYYFEYNEIGFEEHENNLYGDYLKPYEYNWNNYEDNYRMYVPYKEQLLSFNSNDVILFKKILSDNKIHGGHGLYYGSEDRGPNFYFYTYVPMTLEERGSNTKKIVFSSFAYNKIFSWGGYYGDFVQLLLVNNTNKILENCMLYDNFLDNVDFMRKTSLDYSDELWEELNNGPIASSEIYSNNKASANYKYVNQSIIGGIRNVPEETIDDYANSLPVLSFKKVDSTDEDKDNNTKNNIVNVITNPKTWNNGIVILAISMIVIIGSSFVLIRKRKV